MQSAIYTKLTPFSKYFFLNQGADVFLTHGTVPQWHGPCAEKFSNAELEKDTENGGEGGIRTPGAVTLNGFQDRRFQPLSHLSI